MDGTLYLDDNLFDGVLDFLAAVKARGGRYLFLTNNSSRGVEDYVSKLRRLGIEAEAEDFLTSVDATIAVLKKEFPAARCYTAGTASFRRQLAEAGIAVTDRLDDAIDLLLWGFDRELTFQKLEDSCILLGRDIPWLATNPDWVCPTAYGYVPDCGSFCQMLTRATGREPRFLGKPQPDMVHLALSRTSFAPHEAVMVGDRLYTDIACGINAGIDTVFVLSGEGTRQDIEDMNIRPTWVMEDISQLYRQMEDHA
ncbi:MAG: HAD-IIA family hydrolase [Oscillospiraceae bacterium]|nr:HAD-IIA family hydrolase [Oscillospiraceae bacterium]